MTKLQELITAIVIALIFLAMMNFSKKYNIDSEAIKVVEVTSGNTLLAEFSQNTFPDFMGNRHVIKIKDLPAPSSDSDCDVERALALSAKLSLTEKIKFTTIKVNPLIYNDGYIIADVYSNGELLSEKIIHDISFNCG